LTTQKKIPNQNSNQVSPVYKLNELPHSQTCSVTYTTTLKTFTAQDSNP